MHLHVMWSHPQEVLWSIPGLMDQLCWSEWEMGGATSSRKSSQVASQNGSINFVCWGHIALFQLQALSTKDRKSLGTQSTEISDCSILSSLDRAAVIDSTGSWCGTPPLLRSSEVAPENSADIPRESWSQHFCQQRGRSRSLMWFISQILSLSQTSQCTWVCWG